jgi:hypothetical protein
MATSAHLRGGTLFFSFVIGLLVVDPAPAWAQSGLQIMQKQRELQRTKDEEEQMVMKLINAGGETKQRRIAIYTLTGPLSLSKTLVRFLAPRDVENTGLLTWEAKDGDDDQWLYLPATRKVRRIASTGKKNRFMGSDFAFEDLRPENLALYSYTVTGSETLGNQECYLIDAAPATERQAADSGYSRRKLWIRKDNYHTVKREYYDKKGKLEKTENLRKLINVKGTIWRADEVEMHDVQAGTRTVLLVESRALDRGLKDSFFTEAELTRH